MNLCQRFYITQFMKKNSEILKSVQSAFEKLGVYMQFNKSMLEKTAGLDPKLVHELYP